MASILIGSRPVAVGLMPDLFLAVIASWMVLSDELSLVDTALLGALDDADRLDVPAFAEFFAAEYFHRRRCLWALPAGVCVVEHGRACIICPERLIDATWEDDELREQANASTLRATGWAS